MRQQSNRARGSNKGWPSSVTSSGRFSLFQHAGMKFFRIPMTTHEVPTPAQLTQFLALVNDPANQPVYVHCQGGRHRTGVMTAVSRGDRQTGLRLKDTDVHMMASVLEHEKTESNSSQHRR